MLIICYVSLIISLCFTDNEESYYDYDKDDSDDWDFMDIIGSMKAKATKPEGEKKKLLNIFFLNFHFLTFAPIF